jgi:CheY-like chemotaxis protein
VPRLKVLVVEDNEPNLDMLCRRLERFGYEVLRARSGEQAVTLTAETLPDAVLMDLGLPGMDGFEATRLIKSDPRNRKVSIIALTARTMKDDVLRALQAGCDHYETKPVVLARVLQKLDALISKGRESQGSE